MEYQGRTPMTPQATGDMPGDTAAGMDRGNVSKATLQATLAAHAREHDALKKLGYDNGESEPEMGPQQEGSAFGDAALDQVAADIMSAVNAGDVNMLKAALRAWKGM